MIEIKTPAEVAKMRRAGIVVAEIHAVLREQIQPGVTPREVGS